MLVEAHMTSVVDRETDTGPPAAPLRSTGDLLDLDAPLDAGEAPKLLCHVR